MCIRDRGIEAITLSLLPFDPSLYAAAFVTVDLIDPLGDLIPGSRIFAGQIGFSGGLSWQVARNLTDSALSFSGVRFEYEFGIGTTPFVLNGGLFGFYGGNVGFAEVPEPSSFALCAVALLATSLSRTTSQRRRSAASGPRGRQESVHLTEAGLLKAKSLAQWMFCLLYTSRCV